MDDFEIKFKQYNRWNVQSAKEMRNNPTPAEKQMRQEILKNKPLGYKFTRQKPIWSFIVDFYCSKLALVIELDWEIHKKTKKYDAQRTCFLKEQWLSVIRYWNNEALKNPDKIYKDILDIIKEIEKNIKSRWD